MCHCRNSEFIDCTESISQELQNIVNQFHMNDSQVKLSASCTVALHNTHTDRNLSIINTDIWHQCIDNVQDEISRYILVSMFWYTPK